MHQTKLACQRTNVVNLTLSCGLHFTHLLARASLPFFSNAERS